jgi:hypothetical protein
MEFLSGMFEGDGNAGDLHEAFMQGEKAARDFVGSLIKLSKPWLDKGKPMEGSVLMFVGVLRAAGLIKSGVYQSIRQHGEQSPVKKTWDVLEQALTAENVDKAMGEILRNAARGQL